MTVAVARPSAYFLTFFFCAVPFSQFYRKKLAWAGNTWSDVFAAMRAFETWQYLKRTGRLPPRDEREWARREFLNLTKYGWTLWSARGAEGSGGLN